jgi:histidinol phosphate phosphatase hisN-like protein
MTREELIKHLIDARIAGPVATRRENNLANFRLMAQRDPGYTFGLPLRREWTFDDVLASMAQRCGVGSDPMNDAGDDTIDPELTVARLEAMGDLLREVAERRGRVLIATGHPTGLLVVHVEVARALRAAGCTLLEPDAVWQDVDRTGTPHERHVRHVLGVAVASQGANLLHTHSPTPMKIMLDALASAGQRAPDLVLADHGYAGAAGAAGVPTVGFADCNDPALFAGEAEGDVAVCVPLDDNVAPQLYAPMTDHLIERAFGQRAFRPQGPVGDGQPATDGVDGRSLGIAR